MKNVKRELSYKQKLALACNAFPRNPVFYGETVYQSAIRKAHHAYKQRQNSAGV